MLHAGETAGISALKRLLVEVAGERSLDGLLQLIVRRVADIDSAALCRMWLIKPGDICDRCPQREVCPQNTRCLHLVASDGRSLDAQAPAWKGLHGRFARFPLAVRKIGQVAITGESVVVWDIHRDGSEWIENGAWAQEEVIRGMAAQPLVFRGEIIGVFAVFTRAQTDADELIWYRMLADHAAAAIVNARAFDEIDRLKERLEQENAYLREEICVEGAFGDIVGSSPALNRTIQQIEMVATTDATVLVTGESGTGKELVAREIHRRSRRQDGPMIKVNCAAIPRDLYESEFFGHVIGAFSGAVRDRVGRFEMAHGGSLFLDEVGEIPLELQAKLLRVIQEGTYERIGEPISRQADVRLIAATNRDLRQLVAEGQFREDLYYRLNVFPIDIAPLRERKEDIPALVQSFVMQSCQRMARPQKRLTKATLNRLMNYHWPGNIRELQNLIERAVITSQGTNLIFDLPNSRGQSPKLSPTVTEAPILTAHEIRQLEKDNIMRALDEAEGRVSGPHGAAARLGLKPSTLTSRMKAMGIHRGARS